MKPLKWSLFYWILHHKIEFFSFSSCKFKFSFTKTKFKFFHDSWFWAIFENERIITLSAITLYNNAASWEFSWILMQKEGHTVFHSQG